MLKVDGPVKSKLNDILQGLKLVKKAWASLTLQQRQYILEYSFVDREPVGLMLDGGYALDMAPGEINEAVAMLAKHVDADISRLEYFMTHKMGSQEAMAHRHILCELIKIWMAANGNIKPTKYPKHSAIKFAVQALKQLSVYSEQKHPNHKFTFGLSKFVMDTENGTNAAERLALKVVKESIHGTKHNLPF